jgi:hypothetical protein
LAGELFHQGETASPVGWLLLIEKELSGLFSFDVSHFSNES